MTATKPDFLLIIADQMIPFLTGAYGHPVVQTPNLERLVRRGVRFDAAYAACPVCCPSRAALMTGRHQSSIAAWDNGAPLASDQPTIAHYLALAGYDPVLSGKMHFVGADQLHGFSRRLTTDIYPADFSWTPQSYSTGLTVKGHARDYVGDAIHIDDWSQYLSYDEETHFRALEYLRARGSHRRAADDNQPFFLCVSYHHPHEPFWPPKAFWDRYEGAEIDLPHIPDNMDSRYSQMDRWLNIFHGTAEPKDLRQPDSLRRLRRAYYALVTWVDEKVGELLDTLDAAGLSDSTVVVFCSDHGDMLGEKGMVQKRCFYEWSARVPLIMRFPDGRNAGGKVTDPVSLIDLMPTFLDLAGCDRLPMDGRSLLPLIAGSGEPHVVFSEYHAQGVRAPCFMVRRGRLKLVYVHGHDCALHDLDADPDEWTNLAGEADHAALVDELRGLILARFDPEAIARQVSESIERRILIRAAMQATRTRWDHRPDFDPRRPILEQYLP